MPEPPRQTAPRPPRNAAEVQDGSQYSVLLIITDGVISDMAQTKEAIVNVSWGRTSRAHLPTRLGRRWGLASPLPYHPLGGTPAGFCLQHLKGLALGLGASVPMVPPVSSPPTS